LEASSYNENVHETSGGSRKSNTEFLAWNAPDGNSITRYPPSLPPERLVYVTPHPSTPQGAFPFKLDNRWSNITEDEVNTSSGALYNLDSLTKLKKIE
jgi:hypothetical protein